MPPKISTQKKLLLGSSLALGVYLLTRKDVPDALKKAVAPVKDAVSSVVRDMSLPRGLRNNNPLNLRKGVNWIGRAGDDGAFDIFKSMYYGWRAGLKNFQTHHGRGENTITKLITKWAPPSENDTAKYIGFVAKSSGYPKDQLISLTDKETVAKVLYAMAQMENGPELAKKKLSFSELQGVVNQY
jgi:hypothetical protein